MTLMSKESSQYQSVHEEIPSPRKICGRDVTWLLDPIVREIHNPM